MKAIICNSLSGPDYLEVKDMPSKKLKEEQVRVRVRAAALNFPDVLMTYGKYQFKPELPFIPGMEATGDIIEVGAGVKHWKLGDRVLTKSKTGAFTEETVVEQRQLQSFPNVFSYEQGAAFTVAYMTAYVALVLRGNIKPGETVVIHGAGGGVGAAAVDVAKWQGAKVIAVASTDEKLELARGCGADHLVNHRNDDFVDRVKQLTSGNGADIIYDPVGGRVFERSLKCIAWGGRLLIIGFAGGHFGVLKTNLALLKGCSVVGVRAGEYTRRNPEAGKQAIAALYEAAEQQKINPVVTKTWKLEETASALKWMEDGKCVGKNCIVFP